MAIRKTRIHECGGSTVDTRTSPMMDRQPLARKQLHKTNLSYADEKLQFSRSVRQLPVFPKLNSKSEAPNKNRKLRQPLLATARQSLAGDKFFDKDVFDRKFVEQYPVMAHSQSVKTIQRPYRFQDKVIRHIPEIVRSTPVPNNLQGKVNMDKISEVRKKIRQKYETSTNTLKLFHLWDQDALGVVRTEDVQSMLANIGINININEARALVACYSENQAGSLTLPAFTDMLFKEDDNVYCDLSKIPAPPESIEARRKEQMNTLEELSVNRQTANVAKQLKGHLAHKHASLGAQLRLQDPGKTGVIGFDKFTDVIHNLDIPINLINDRQIKLLFAELGGKNGEKIEYSRIIDHIQQHGEIPEVIPKPQTSSNRSQKSIIPRHFHVLSTADMPPNMIEQISARSRFVRRHMRKVFQNSDKLRQKITNYEKNGRIDQQGLQQFLLDTIQENPSESIGISEIEAFLSTYKYNSDNQVEADHLAQNMFEDDIQTINMGALRDRKLPPANRISSTQKYNTSKVIQMIKTIDSRVFDRNNSSYNVFKKFDVDNDGFISTKDLQRALAKLEIQHTKEDVKELMAFLDDDGNGYTDFKEFSAKISPDTVADNFKEEGNTAISQPSIQYLREKFQAEKSVDQYIKSEIGKFSPDSKMLHIAKSSSRFSASPEFKNTFENFVPPQKTSMYQSEQDRFVTKNRVPISFTSETKSKLPCSNANLALRNRSTHFSSN